MSPKKKHGAIGPFAPPTPREVDETEGEPMAVANDKRPTHAESFSPTTAPGEQYSDEVAHRYKQVPASEIEPKSHAETDAAERPKGYTSPDARGWVKPKAEEEQEPDKSS